MACYLLTTAGHKAQFAQGPERITIRTSYASDTSDRGSLTDKQMQALHDCARLSPGYEFCVARYGGTGSRATHVMVYREGEPENYVGLVGKETVQFYDNDPKTEAAVKRVAHRVYRFSGFVMQ